MRIEEADPWFEDPPELVLPDQPPEKEWLKGLLIVAAVALYLILITYFGATYEH